jgi:flagellar biosynthesis component FlhA
MATSAKPVKATHLLAPFAVILVVLLMIVPVPPIMLDLLLSIDIRSTSAWRSCCCSRRST